MQKWTRKTKSEEDIEIMIFKIKSFIGLVVLIILAIFVLLINFILIPFDLLRKPIRNYVYKQKRKKRKHHKTPV